MSNKDNLETNEPIYYDINNNETLIKKTDDVIYIDTILPAKKLPFNMFPKTIRDKILKSSMILILFDVLCISLFIFSGFYLELFILMCVITFILGSNIYNYYICTVGNDFTYFTGYIVSFELRGFIPSERYYRICISNYEETKQLSFDYYGKEKFSEGSPVTLIIAQGEPIKLTDSGYYLANYLSVVFSNITKPDIEDIENNINQNTTIEDFMSDDN